MPAYLMPVLFQLVILSLFYLVIKEIVPNLFLPFFKQWLLQELFDNKNKKDIKYLYIWWQYTIYKCNGLSNIVALDHINHYPISYLASVYILFNLSSTQFLRNVFIINCSLFSICTSMTWQYIVLHFQIHATYSLFLTS